MKFHFNNLVIEQRVDQTAQAKEASSQVYEFDKIPPKDLAVEISSPEELEQAFNDSIEQLETNVNNAKNQSDVFFAVEDFYKKRRNQHFEYIMLDLDTEDSAQHSFDALYKISMDSPSVYVRRLTEWCMNRELARALSWNDFEIDAPFDEVTGQSDYSDPTKVKVGFSQLALTKIETNPARKVMYNYALEQVKNYTTNQYEANFQNDDLFTPDPYMLLAKPEHINYKIDKRHYPSHTELALETAHLFDVDMTEISPPARERLFSVGLELDEVTYDRIKNTAAELDKDQRKLFAEAFLATEFGDDLGDIVLNLAEKYGPDTTEIFAELDKIRADGSKIAEHFGTEDGINQMVATAFIKRATELLALAEVEGLSAPAESLGYMRDATSQLAKALDEDSFIVTAIGKNAEYGTLQAKASKVTITARPHGSNARLGMTVRYPKKQRINIRLDYDRGDISLDIGSMAKSGVNVGEMAGKLGTDLARGELALAKRRAEQGVARGETKQEITLHGNHVREAFADLGDVPEEKFASYVNHFLYSLKLDSN